MKARPPQSWQLSFLLISALQYYCVAQSESSDPSPSFHPQVILSSSYQRSSSPSVHVQSQNNFIGNATLGASYNLSSQFDLSASALWMYGRVIGMGSFVASMPNGLFSWSNVKPFLGTVALSYHCICSDDSSEQISCSVGKISALAAFDLNPYANDPTTQFMNLVVLNNGAHELCAEARGGKPLVLQHASQAVARWFPCSLVPCLPKPVVLS